MKCAAWMAPVMPNAQQLPQDAWSLTKPLAPVPRQSTAVGRRSGRASGSYGTCALAHTPLSEELCRLRRLHAPRHRHALAMTSSPTARSVRLTPL